MQAQTVTIIGMSRTGVSIALALKASPMELTIIGHDSLRELGEEALEMGAIDKVEWNLISAASQADILLFVEPMSDLLGTMQAIGDDIQSHTLILDLAPLKGQSLKWAEQYLQSGHYVGVRPILSADFLPDGREVVSAASADMFRNSIFCLMPAVTADPQAVATAVNFGALLGAKPYFIDPIEYDGLVQGVETLPGLLAAAMFNTVQGSPGWRDMLRFANTPFGISTQSLVLGTDIVHLALNDKTATLHWLDSLIEELGRWRGLIQNDDPELLELTIADLFIKRERWLKERSENEWAEETTIPVETPGLAEQVLGGWINRGRREDSDGK